MKKYIFFDFNGTIIDDVDLCLELLNKILKGQNKRELSLEEYKNVFTFPIIEYYRRAGVDFNIESFDSLAVKFINEYQPRSLECGLYKNSIETFKWLNENGYKIFILSASEKNNLLEQCRHYRIDSYFDAILGIDNIYAKSKVDIAKNYINESNINVDEVLFIGDTLHDYEVAKAIGVDCVLVSCGHQSVDVLRGANVEILDNISEIKNLLLNL